MPKFPFVSRKRFEEVVQENVSLKDRADNLNLYLYCIKRRFPESFYTLQQSLSGMPGYCEPVNPEAGPPFLRGGSFANARPSARAQ